MKDLILKKGNFLLVLVLVLMLSVMWIPFYNRKDAGLIASKLGIPPYILYRSLSEANSGISHLPAGYGDSQDILVKRTSQQENPIDTTKYKEIASWTDTDPSDGVKYYYVIYALNGRKEIEDAIRN